MSNAEKELKKPLVLIIDDDATTRLLTRSALDQAGFRIEEAENGVQGLVAFKTLQPDLVLLDVMMPELDGFCVCGALRNTQEGKHTPVVMVTSLDDVESINRAYSVGATDFITKPINWTVLPHRVRYILRTSEVEKALRSAHRLSNAVIEGVPVGVALLDDSFRILFVNGRFKTILHLEDQPLQESSLEEALGEKLAAELNLKGLLDRVSSGDAAMASEQPILSRGTDTSDVVDIKVFPLKGHDEQLEYVLIIIEDVSERIQMEKRIRRMDRLSALGELSSSIAHEVRNPLVAISSNAQLLYENIEGNEFQKELAELIIVGSERIEKLMKDVLEFARPRQATFSRQKLERIVRQALRFVAPKASQKQIQMETNMAKSIPLLNLDATQIHQVLVNLLLNASRAAPLGGRISVVLCSSGGECSIDGSKASSVILAVSDNGEGIVPEHIDKIFDPFFTTHPNGTGLGLAISHSILRDHNVDIQVESQVGKGTTFFLKFPVN